MAKSFRAQRGFQTGRIRVHRRERAFELADGQLGGRGEIVRKIQAAIETGSIEQMPLSTCEMEAHRKAD